MSGVRLTEAEREALSKMLWDTTLDELAEVVEAILSARLAAVEALADQWDSDDYCDNDITYGSAADEVRKAAGLPHHILLAHATCSCGAEHDRRGTGESGFAWHARHRAALTPDPMPPPAPDQTDERQA